MPADAMKKCTKCEEEKAFGCFSSHHTTLDRLRPECKSCRVKRSREWAKLNPEKIAQSTKLSRAKNPGVFRDRQRRYFAKNRAKVYATMALWRDRNREAVREKNKKWQTANKDKYLLAVRVCNHRKRGRGQITKSMIEELKVSQKNMCIVCRVSIKERFHLDHIMPLARGGDNARENLQLLCPTCNQQKTARDPVEFMQSRGLLL